MNKFYQQYKDLFQSTKTNQPYLNFNNHNSFTNINDKSIIKLPSNVKNQNIGLQNGSKTNNPSIFDKLQQLESNRIFKQLYEPESYKHPKRIYTEVEKQSPASKQFQKIILPKLKQYDDEISNRFQRYKTEQHKPSSLNNSLLISYNYKNSNLNIELQKTLKKYNNHFYKPAAGLPSARKNYNPKHKFYQPYGSRQHNSYSTPKAKNTLEIDDYDTKKKVEFYSDKIKRKDSLFYQKPSVVQVNQVQDFKPNYKKFKHNSVYEVQRQILKRNYANFIRMRDEQTNYDVKEFKTPVKNRNRSGHKKNQFSFNSNKSAILIKDHQNPQQIPETQKQQMSPNPNKNFRSQRFITQYNQSYPNYVQIQEELKSMPYQKLLELQKKRNEQKSLSLEKQQINLQVNKKRNKIPKTNINQNLNNNGYSQTQNNKSKIEQNNLNSYLQNKVPQHPAQPAFGFDIQKSRLRERYETHISPKLSLYKAHQKQIAQGILFSQYKNSYAFINKRLQDIKNFDNYYHHTSLNDYKLAIIRRLQAKKNIQTRRALLKKQLLEQ